jgi:hypothetical protein
VVAFEVTARDELQVFQQLCRVVETDDGTPRRGRPSMTREAH